MKHLSFCLLALLLVLSCEKEKPDDGSSSSFTSPVDGQTIYNNTEVELTISTSAILWDVKFSFDDVMIGSVLTAPYSIKWTPISRPGGWHVIKAFINPKDGKEITRSVSVFIPYEIGAVSQGGIVFYLDETEEHGLVFAQSDLEFNGNSELFWGPEQYIGASDSTKGNDNTQLLANHVNMADYFWSVFKLGYITAGYSDWYIPSKTEMQMLSEFSNKPETPDYLKLHSVYWTSTECCRSQACAFDFESSAAFSTLKADSSFRVRPIRKF